MYLISSKISYNLAWNISPDVSRSSSRWDSHFHSCVLTIYVCLYWLGELVVFYSLVHRGYIRKVSVQLIPQYFSRDCSTDSISCSERKKRYENNIKTSCRLQSTWLIIQSLPLLSLRCRSDPLSLRCCTAIAAMSLHWCWSCCRYAVATQSLHSRSGYRLRCCSAVTPL